jgi:hypothetical protein
MPELLRYHCSSNLDPGVRGNIGIFANIVPLIRLRIKRVGASVEQIQFILGMVLTFRQTVKYRMIRDWVDDP